MSYQNKKAMERSNEISKKNTLRMKKLLNAPIEVKRKNAKINLIVSTLLIVISIVLLLTNLSVLGQIILILGVVSFCVNFYLFFVLYHK